MYLNESLVDVDLLSCYNNRNRARNVFSSNLMKLDLDFLLLYYIIKNSVN